MNWDDLRHLAAALRHGSMTGAARELGCDHSTVSRRLEALEAALGTRLFLRTPEGLLPTHAASELQPLLEQMQETARAVQRRAAGFDERTSGVVRLTAPEAFAPLVLEHLLELRQRHPELVLEVHADDRALDLARGEVDLALRLTPSKQPDLLVKKLTEAAATWPGSPTCSLPAGMPAAHCCRRLRPPRVARCRKSWRWRSCSGAEVARWCWAGC